MNKLKILEVLLLKNIKANKICTPSGTNMKCNKKHEVVHGIKKIHTIICCTKHTNISYAVIFLHDHHQWTHMSAFTCCAPVDRQICPCIQTPIPFLYVFFHENLHGCSSYLQAVLKILG